MTRFGGRLYEGALFEQLVHVLLSHFSLHFAVPFFITFRSYQNHGHWLTF